MKRVYSIEDANPNLITTELNNHPETGVGCLARFSIDILKNQLIISGTIQIDRVAEKTSEIQTFEASKINLTPALFQSVIKIPMSYNIDGVSIKVFSYGAFNTTSYHSGSDIFEPNGSIGYFITAYEPTNSLCINVKTPANGERYLGAHVIISIPINTASLSLY